MTSVENQSPKTPSTEKPGCWSAHPGFVVMFVESDRAGRRNGGKILLGVEHVVEEVRQGVHRHQRDNLDDVRLRIAGVIDSLHIGVADLSAGLDDLACELDGRVPLRVARMSLPSAD